MRVSSRTWSPLLVRTLVDVRASNGAPAGPRRAVPLRALPAYLNLGGGGYRSPADLFDNQSGPPGPRPVSTRFSKPRKRIILTTVERRREGVNGSIQREGVMGCTATRMNG